MSITVLRCPTCNKIAEQASISKLGNQSIIKYHCGHSVIVNTISTQDKKYITFDGSRELYPFQRNDLLTIEGCNARALLTYECGLGKTVTSLFTTYNHPECLPCLVICKSKLTVQWMKQIYSITGSLPVIITNGKQVPIPGVKYHIISFDLCDAFQDKVYRASQVDAEKLNGNQSFNSLGRHGFKTIIIDEVQHIKSLTAKRYQAVSEICKFSEHIIGLSATPFKNNAGEYFPILNILQPTMFPIKEQFFRDHCNVEYTGGGYKKVAGLRNPSRFRELTKHFIIHHTREEVLPDLPKKRRNFEYTYIEDKDLQKAYDKQLDLLDEFVRENEGKKKDLSYYSNLLEYMTKMRHITGLSKVDDTVDDATEFITSTSRKLTIACHHIDVADLIEKKLADMCAVEGLAPPLRIKGGSTAHEVEAIKDKFINEMDRRILIVSTLAAGEGLDGLQKVCQDCIQVERQWNSVNEEQLEDRFSRPGGMEGDHININYKLAISTIDDHLTTIIEKKRSWVKEGITGEKVNLAENAVLNELTEALIKAGRPKWRL